jgi:hypothetical protein
MLRDRARNFRDGALSKELFLVGRESAENGTLAYELQKIQLRQIA